MYNFELNEKKIVACFSLPTGIIIFIQQADCLVVGLSKNPPEWHQIARIDCLEAAESVYACLSPLLEPQPSAILIGTQDGHVYQLQISKKNLTLLCDIQQPVTSILIVDSQTTVIVGKYGKIAMLNGSTKETLISFSPTAVEDCFYSKQKLYLMGSNQLLSMEMKTSAETGFLSDANYCKVKFIRSVHVNEETVFILTENGTIYQSSLVFIGSNEDQPRRERSGAEVKPILQEIHRCADQTKALSAISDRVLLDVAQLSVALHMVNQNVSNSFPVTIRSISDPRSPRSQNLIVSITNKSAWNLSSLHWSFQICAQGINQSSLLFREEWKTGDMVELEHHLVLPDDTFGAEVKTSLIFRVVDLKKHPEPQSLCFFPLSTIKLSVLDFLEPAAANLFDEKNNVSDVLGFSRTQIRGCPWPILLQQSWHRGFAQKFGYTSPLQIVVRCGSHLVRMILKEDENHSDKIWILRIETSNSNILRLLCTEIFQLLEARHPLTKSDVVNIPSYVLAQLQVIFLFLIFAYPMTNCLCLPVKLELIFVKIVRSKTARSISEKQLALACLLASAS